MVSLCSRAEADLCPVSVVLSDSWSSKNLRQSSDVSAPSSTASGSTWSSSSSSAPPYFGFGGRAANSSTHHELSSVASVGNVVIFSNNESRFSATYGCSVREYAAKSPLRLVQYSRIHQYRQELTKHREGRTTGCHRTRSAKCPRTSLVLLHLISPPYRQVCLLSSFSSVMSSVMRADIAKDL